ncbi:hypothetical protein [Agromyces ramosus]|uniref:Protein kinase domain-containing protein n=1 Tax=Agromyces ramosus TaxID=33879 RepID=A0ABU0RD55_9MICO|nr:hypothetical protein [Agromyces ramosus]MDQ0895998.1 hypothetical protein [Agromyces ramosus]
MSRSPRPVRPPVETAAVEAERPADTRVAGYRLLRRIASGDRADIYLATVDHSRTSGDEESGTALVALRIYDRARWNESIAVEVEAMSSDASGTLPLLYDIATLDDGRCCLAVERIAGIPASRLLAERRLEPGEAVTLLAPIVAAVAELARLGFVHTRLTVADVLIDDAGRPRLVGLGALQRIPAQRGADRTALLRRSHEALAGLISDVGDATRPAGALEAVDGLLRARLDARPFTSCEEEVERALFAAATPEPIAGIVPRARPAALPARMTTTPESQHGAPMPVDDEAGAGPADLADAVERRRGPGGLRTLLALAQLPGIDEFAGAADVDPTRPLLARLRAAASTRQRPLAFGALIGGGALVLLLTLVPPATAGGAGPAPTMPTADAETPLGDASAAGGDRSPAASASPRPRPAVDSDDAVAAVAELLELRSSCFATLDLACLDQVAQPGSAVEADDRAAIVAAREGSAAESVEFDLDAIAVSAEMGAAVLVTVQYIDAEREPASILVMRSEAGWRLRELFD